jgi:aminoglycoside phosphotransferase family enzyme
MNLIKDFEQGKIKLFGAPEKVIETLLSKIFFFGNTVCKVYKWDKAFYGDLSDPDFRKKFIEEDFFWNHFMCPKIYTKLLPLTHYQDGSWIETDPEHADDFVIVMNKLRDERTLTDWADDKRLTKELAKTLTQIIITKQRELTKSHSKALAQLLKRNCKDIETEDLADLRDWSYLAADHIEKSKTDGVVKQLLSILETPEYNKWAAKAHKTASIDGNGDNVIISRDREFFFIDILPPKFNWRVEDEIMNIGRAAADVSTFMNSGLADVMYDAYEELAGMRPPLVVRKLYEVRGAMIQVAYRYVLNQPERAKKYLAFVEKTLATL